MGKWKIRNNFQAKHIIFRKTQGISVDFSYCIFPAWRAVKWSQHRRWSSFARGSGRIPHRPHQFQEVYHDKSVDSLCQRFLEKAEEIEAEKKNPTTVIYDVSDFLNRIYEDNIRMAEQLGYYRAKSGEQNLMEGEFIEVRDDEVEGIEWMQPSL